MSNAVALVLLPPPHISAVIDPVRSANDQSYARGWASHITILFPFTPMDDLSYLVDALQSAFLTAKLQPFDVKLDKVSRFATRDYETIYLGLSENDQVQALWKISSEAIKHPKDGRPYIPHMTLGQTARNPDSIAFLTDKGEKIVEQYDLSWHVDSVFLLRRSDNETMEMYAQIPIGNANVAVSREYEISGTPTYHNNTSAWVPTLPSPSSKTSLSLATYNVLHDVSFPLEYRFPALRDAILGSNADMICLQEVTDQFLSSLLGDSQIKEQFRWCSRSNKAIMESERNIVLLAREDYGFEWVRIELGGKHKAAIIAGLRTPNAMVVIAGVHLSAGRAAPILKKKTDELSMLVAYLHMHHAADEWIIVGDMNWPDSEQPPLEDEFTDVWTLAGGETYDPTTNPLAAASARESREPQRYDRILIKRGGLLSVSLESLELFGLPPAGATPPSDHWGLKAAVQIGATSKSLATVIPSADTTPVPPLTLLSTTLTNAELHDLCVQHGCILSVAQDDALKLAVETLRAFVSDVSSPAPAIDSIVNPSAVRLIVAPVGSFAMGYHNPGSDVDCVVVGNINPGTFWNLMRWKIRAAVGGTNAVQLRRFVKDASVQMMELEVCGVKMDIQYCPAGKLIDYWEELPNMPRDSSLFALPVSALRTLNAHRDVLALKNALPCLDNFRVAHRALKLFLKLQGLIGARFGFLGGIHLAFLLARLCLLLPPSATSGQLVRSFFHTYSRWDWGHDIVTVPIPGAGRVAYRRSSREPICILSIEKPMVNMTINSNPHSLEVLKSVFVSVDSALEDGMSWKDICSGRDGDPPFRQFLKCHRAFVKIEISYWGSSCMKGRALVGWLESRFVNLLVQLHTNVPSLRVRLWPSRLSGGNIVDDQNLHGFYLFGLVATTSGPTSDEDQHRSRRDNAKVMSDLTTTLRAFESDVHQNSRYYDPVDAFVFVTHVGSSQLPSNMVFDTHKWSDNGFDDEDGSDDEDEDAADTAEVVQDGILSTSAPISTQKKQTKTKTTGHLPASKLRTSSDVYNRLMWDPSVSSSDYVIGYEDRFKGVKEMPLGSWKREVEDEAFIPFHRVVHFRRKSDNVIVWDRKTKTDLVFGSGVTTLSS